MDIRAFFKAKETPSSVPGTSQRDPGAGDQGSGRLDAAGASNVSCRQKEAEMPPAAAGAGGQLTANVESRGGGLPIDLGEKETGPSQPILPDYPKSTFGKQRRAFSADYFKKYTFIEYSKEADAVFCFPCRQFQCSSGYRDAAFVTNGVRDWKNVLLKLQRHVDCVSHRQCMEQWQCFLKSKNTGSVAVQLSEAHRETVKSNREYAGAIVDMLLLLGKQGIALRGHDESNTSANRGNFLEFCKWYSKHNEAFSSRLQMPFNLTSHDAQNELLEIAATSVKKKIIHSVEENGFYTVLVDEARSFKQEQMTVCLRYAEGLEIKERFIGFVDCSEGADAVALFGQIKQCLEQCGLYSLPIVAQSYDGAAVMSGHVNGVQTKLRQDHPSAIYIHCMAHKLNLILVDACKANRTAMGFFLTLESLYTFFAQPGTHHAYKQAQNELGVKAELTALSDTRWACRWRNVSAVKDSMQALTSTLSELSEPPYRRFVEASGLLNNVKRADFCVSLIIFHHLLSTVHVTHKALQGKDTTLSKAAGVLESLIKYLEDMRTNQKWEEVWIEIETFCKSVGVSTVEDERPRKRPSKQPAALDCAVVTSTLGQREYQTSTAAQSLKQKWASQLYFPVLDTLLGECSRRFSAESMDIAKSVDAVFKCDFKGAESLISQYSSLLSINPKLAQAEMAMVTSKITRIGISMDNIKAELGSGHYPNFHKLFRLALSLPVGTATCERSFSAMRRIRNWLRTTMLQERMSSLSLLHIESDLTDQLQREEIIDAYDAKTRRRILLH